MLPIETITRYGIKDEQFAFFPADDNTLNVLVTDQPTRKASYKPVVETDLREDIQIVGLEVGPDFDDSEILDILFSQARMALKIFVPRWIDPVKGLEVNERLAKLHIKYRENICFHEPISLP